jgi:hypothetical protein
MLVTREITQPVRPKMTWEQTWQGPDQGLIRCWEIGRERAEKMPTLVNQCRAGELPVLGWKGGVSRALKKKEKFGALKYLAQWQGLRGEDLRVQADRETTLTCARTGMVVTFTPERSKYLNQLPDGDE